MTSANKKEAKRLFEKFKKEYNRVWENEDITSSTTTSDLDYFWYENRPSCPEVSDEIVNLVANESIEMKLVFNNFVLGGFQIPQKRWFLGDENSLDLLPRQPSNVQCEFIGALAPDGQIKETLCMSMHMVPHYCQHRKKIKVGNDEVSVLTLKNEEDAEDWYYHVSYKDNTYAIKCPSQILCRPPDANEVIQPVTEFDFKGTLISLVDGKLVSTNPVVIYLGDKKMNEGIVQWALKQGGAQVLILYNTFFMATGKIQKTNNGFLIKCHELYGSYGTGSFIISPNFSLLVRTSALNKTVNTTPKHLELDRLQNAIASIESKMEPENESGYTSRQTQLLSYMCEDAEILVAMKNEYVSDPAPDHYLSEFEKFVYNFHKTKERILHSRTTPRQCSHLHGRCPEITKLKDMAKEWIQQGGEEHEPSFVEFVFITSRFFEIYLTAIILGREVDVDLCHDFRRSAPNEHRQDPIDYFPLGSYQLCDPEEEWEFASSSFTEEILSQYFSGYSKVHEQAKQAPEQGMNLQAKMSTITEITLRRRPDLMLFGGTKMPIPLKAIRSFAEWYEVEHFREMKSRGAIENAFQNLNVNGN